MAHECLSWIIWAWVFGVLLFLDGLTFFFRPLKRFRHRAGRFLFIALLFAVFILTTQNLTSKPPGPENKKC